MKKVGFILIALITGSLVWMSFMREPLPPIPEITRELSKEVKLNFSINTMDYSGVELALNEKVEGKGMYVQFKMANAWKTGRPGLVVSGIKAANGFKGGMAPQSYLNDSNREKRGGKDFSDFMKDDKGKNVSTYSFVQTLVEGKKGETYLRMSYAGPAMDMIQTLEIPRPVTVPAHISRQFTPEGIIQFQPGTVAFDPKIKGFHIPVLIR